MKSIAAFLVSGVLAVGTLLSAHAADAPAPGIDASDPGKLIQNVANATLKDLDAHRADYRADPSKVNSLVEKYLLPHFDVDYAARSVLGQHWRAANDDQRKRFVQAFYHSLVANYGSSLVDFTSDRLKIFPAQVSNNGDRATVRTEVKRSNGSVVKVDYTLHKTADGWKAYDVVIEGISYIKSYQEDFSAEIDQKGLDEVITRIEKGDRPAAVKAAAGDTK